MSTGSRVETARTSGVVAAAPARVAGLAALLLGVFMIYGVGFAQISAVHDAAHDGRNSFSFPCH
jgi:cobalt transporter subunit CbtB